MAIQFFDKILDDGKPQSGVITTLGAGDRFVKAQYAKRWGNPELIIGNGHLHISAVPVD